MPTYISGPSNAGLAAAAGGVEAFTKMFMQARQQNQQMDVQNQQLAAQRQLQQMQMMKLQKELEPTSIDLSKVQLISQMHSMDPDKYQGLLNTYMKKTLDNAQTPAQVGYLQHMVPKTLGAQDSSQFGQDSNQVFNSFGVAPPTSQNANSIPVSKDELGLAEKVIGLDASANIAGARNQTSMTLEQMKAALAQQGFSVKQDIAKQDRATRVEIAKIQAGSKNKGQDFGDKVALKQLDQINRRVEDAQKKLQPDAFSSMLDPNAQMNAYQDFVSTAKERQNMIMSSPKLRAQFPNIVKDTQQTINDYGARLGIAPQGVSVVPNQVNPANPAMPSPAALKINEMAVKIGASPKVKSMMPGTSFSAGGVRWTKQADGSLKPANRSPQSDGSPVPAPVSDLSNFIDQSTGDQPFGTE